MLRQGTTAKAVLPASLWPGTRDDQESGLQSSYLLGEVAKGLGDLLGQGPLAFLLSFATPDIPDTLMGKLG